MAKGVSRPRSKVVDIAKNAEKLPHPEKAAIAAIISYGLRSNRKYRHHYRSVPAHSHCPTGRQVYSARKQWLRAAMGGRAIHVLLCSGRAVAAPAQNARNAGAVPRSQLQAACVTLWGNECDGAQCDVTG